MDKRRELVLANAIARRKSLFDGVPQEALFKTPHRPSAGKVQYHVSFCDVVVECGSAGYSKIEIADHLDVTDTALDNWSKKHPEFAEAMRQAYIASLALYERLLNYAIMNGDKVNIGALTQLMKARFIEYRNENKPSNITIDNRQVNVGVDDSRQLARKLLQLAKASAPVKEIMEKTLVVNNEEDAIIIDENKKGQS